MRLSNYSRQETLKNSHWGKTPCYNFLGIEFTQSEHVNLDLCAANLTLLNRTQLRKELWSAPKAFPIFLILQG